MQISKWRAYPCPTCGSACGAANGAWLRERRQKAGLTLRAFAQRVGVSAPYICDIELNRRRCLPAMLDAYENIASFEAK